MSDLIERLEAATEGSRELDAEIHAFVLGGKFKELAAGNTMWALFVVDGIQHAYEVPAYTKSLDAAVTLVPENAVSWSMGDSPGGPIAWLCLATGKGAVEVYGFPLPGCTSAALALCIAALKTQELLLILNTGGWL